MDCTRRNKKRNNMIRFLFSLPVTAGLLLPAWSANAGDLPAIKSNAENRVPACATPDRLRAYLRAYNPRLDERYNDIATYYRDTGEALGMRWDYAFFQMIVETGWLSFSRANGERGAVSPKQNNFAGLGAVNDRVHGESFPDVATGVKAHLQHLLMYAGERIEGPVAERTRKIQEWQVLTPWQATFRRPIGYSDMARKWAPHTSDYAVTIAAVGRRFYDQFCSRPETEQSAAAVQAGGAAQSSAATPATGAEPRQEAAANADRSARDRIVDGAAGGSGQDGADRPFTFVAPRPVSTRPHVDANAADGDKGPATGSGKRAEVEATSVSEEGGANDGGGGRVSGVELARQAIERARAEGNATRWSLGAAMIKFDSPMATTRVSLTSPVQEVPTTVPSPSNDTKSERGSESAQAAAVPVVNPADEAIQKLISGKTFLLDATFGVTIPIVFRRNGTMHGEAGSLASYLGAGTDHGRWWTSKGRLCHRWSVWLEREVQCLKLRQTGSVIHWIRDDGKSGTARLASK
jgi:hypothetical protein